jgi:uncharacterized membrane protein
MAPSNPSPPPLPDIERLEAAVANLQARVAALEQRKPLPVPARTSTESHLGLTIVNRVGAVTLIIGIIFFFKYAADNEWIGAATAVVLGMLVGVALIGVGERLRRRGQQAFAQGLAGCGFAILYVSVYAAFGYYRVISRGAGFAGMAAASFFAIAVSLRFASSAVAAVGFIGAFIAPLLVRKAQDTTHAALYVLYLLLLNLVSIATVTRLFRRAQKSALVLAAFNTFWILLCAWTLMNDHHPLVFVLSVLLFAAVHFAASFSARGASGLFGVLYICGHACLAIAGFRALALWAEYATTPGNRANLTSELDSVLLGLYGLLTITYGVFRKSSINRLLGLVLLGIVVIKLYFYDVWLMNSFYRISAFVVLGVLLLAASYVYSRFKRSTGISS